MTSAEGLPLRLDRTGVCVPLGEPPPVFFGDRVPEVHEDRNIPASTMDAPLRELVFIEYLYCAGLDLVPIGI